MFNHGVKTQGTVLRALTTFIALVPLQNVKIFPQRLE
jgi:hypothetical protein